MTSVRNFIAALAVSLPLVAAAQAPAEAKAPLYSIYGTLMYNLQWSEAHDSTAGIASNVRDRFSVSPDSTNLGVRGTANVSHGLGVTYQCETSAFLDGIGSAGICNRNSRVGLTHGTFGTLFFGNWDTPYKAAAYGTKADDPFGNTDAFGTNDIMGEAGRGNVTTGGFVSTGIGGGTTTASALRSATFDVRAQNSIAYWSPKFMGLGIRLQHVVNEFSNVRNAHAIGAAIPLNPTLYSAGVNYDRGPLSVFAAWEMHRDGQGLRVLGLGATGADSPSDDRAWKVGAGYEVPTPFGATTLGVVYESITWTQRRAPAGGFALGNIREYSRPAIALNAKHRMGSHEFRGRFNWADKGDCEFATAGAAIPAGTTACDDLPGISGLSAHQVTLGYAFFLAPSTQLFASYTKISNGRAANYALSAGGGNTGSPFLANNTTAGAALPPGADPQALGVGMRYAF